MSSAEYTNNEGRNSNSRDNTRHGRDLKFFFQGRLARNFRNKADNCFEFDSVRDFLFFLDDSYQDN